MSLINDALRRANKDNKTPALEKTDGSPMQPVQPLAQKNSPLLKLVLLALIVLVLGLAGMLFWKGWQTNSEMTTAKQTAETRSASTAPAETKAPVPPVPVAQAQATAVAAPVPIATNHVTTTLAQANTNVPVATPALVVPPPFKLQGIFYRLSNPTVIINGKNLAVGEKVAGGRVLKIERQSVTMERDGKQEVLTLE